VTPDLQHERCNLRPLERDRRTFRIVFVISVAVTGGRHHLIEVGGQSLEAPHRPLSFRAQQLASPVHPSMLTPLAAMKATGLSGIQTCRAPDCVYSSGIGYVYTYKNHVDPAQGATYFSKQVPILKATFRTQVAPELKRLGFAHPSVTWTYVTPDCSLIWTHTVR
jgi:hypothetical protein